MMSGKEKLRKIVFYTLSVVLIVSAVSCTLVRIMGAGFSFSPELLAAETTLPAVSYQFDNVRKESPPVQETVQTIEAETSTAESIPEPEPPESSAQITEKTAAFQSSAPTKEELAAYDQAHEGENQYPVLEFTSIQGNIAYEGIQVKNSSSYALDIKKELSEKIGFTIEKTDAPQVLIYHTHTCEGFLDYDTGYYYESFYPRTKDKSRNVCAIGEEITKQLNAAGIKTIHDTTYHDDPSYSGAYYRSTDTVNQYLEKYPSIKVVLDIHRDGIGTDTSRSKPVFTANGKKAAQIMILAGYNYDDSEEFKNWEYNLRFALQLQKQAQQMYPDMVRPMNFGDFVYNEDINTGSLLIEVGADSNTVEEVRYTGYLLGQVLSEVLHRQMKGEGSDT